MDGLTQADHDRLDEELRVIIDQLPLPGDSGATLREQMHLAVRGGKRFRPGLVLHSFRSFAPGRAAPHAVWAIAAAYELLHGAFVVHDDIIDEDTRRRGTLNVRGMLAERARHTGADHTASTRVGDAGALLVGDLLLYAASRTVMMADVGTETRARLVAQLDDAVAVSAAGEWTDASRLTVDCETALTMSADKTAVYSFSAPLRAGAVLAGADAAAEDELARVAQHLGIAFQLVDDLIGAFGTPTQAGRDVGADLREGKHTPLVALARETSSWPDVAGALALAHTGPVAVLRAQQELERSGARDEMTALVFDYLAYARADTASLPGGLTALVDEVATEIESRVP
jgi:geranylgeranyl diphosphate synthase type II